VTPLAVLPADEVESTLLPRVGARPLDRDAVDRRVITQIVTRTGGGIDSQAEVGGWPALATNVATWTLPNNPSDDDDGDGYTNAEEWLHELAAALEGP
jgi:hypothetical protein